MLYLCLSCSGGPRFASPLTPFIPFVPPIQRALEAAELALDRCAAGEASFDDVAAQLAEAYAAAGRPELARFVGARPQQ